MNLRNELVEVVYRKLDSIDASPTQVPLEKLREAFRELIKVLPDELPTILMDLDDAINEEVGRKAEQMFIYGYQCGRNPDLLIFEQSERTIDAPHRKVYSTHTQQD